MEWVIPALSGGGIVAGLVAVFKLWPEVRKLRADAGKVTAEAAAISDDSVRETFQAMLQEQREGFTEQLQSQRDGFQAQISPMREELNRQGAELRMLREEVAEVRTKYWRGIGFIRALLHWISEHAHGEHPPVPVPPVEIASDI